MNWIYKGSWNVVCTCWFFYSIYIWNFKIYITKKINNFYLGIKFWFSRIIWWHRLGNLASSMPFSWQKCPMISTCLGSSKKEVCLRMSNIHYLVFGWRYLQPVKIWRDGIFKILDYFIGKVNIVLFSQAIIVGWIYVSRSNKNSILQVFTPLFFHMDSAIEQL